jgi:hypothetical protein
VDELYSTPFLTVPEPVVQAAGIDIKIINNANINDNKPIFFIFIPLLQKGKAFYLPV